MRSEVIMILDKDLDYYVFMRENPKWYRILSRDPTQIKNFFEEYKLIRRKRVVDKIEDFSMMVNLAKELM